MLHKATLEQQNDTNRSGTKEDSTYFLIKEFGVDNNAESTEDHKYAAYTEASDKLAKDFDCWMKKIHHPLRPDNQHLLKWLWDSGGECIKDYKHFCELAEILSGPKYNYSTQPPPLELDYTIAMKEFTERKEMGLEKIVIYVEPETTDELAQRFDGDMRTLYHMPRSDNQHLLAFLLWDMDIGVKNYKHFCELAKILSGPKYNYSTEPPPSESDYNREMEKFEEKYGYPRRISYVR